MLSKIDYLLVKLAEEASEIAQDALKAVEFGLATVEPGKTLSNSQRLASEIIDLSAVLEALVDEGVELRAEGVDTPAALNAAIARKRAKIEMYMGASRNLGKLEKGE